MSDSANSTFYALQREFYSAWFRFHPEEAVNVGQSSFAGLLRPYDDDEIGALADSLESMQATIRTYTEQLEARVQERTEELEQLHQEFLGVSRQAGMAEIAVSILAEMIKVRASR